ncbi:MAG: hypothetical protein RIB78_08130 [Gammaproteobacteria bacterium]
MLFQVWIIGQVSDAKAALAEDLFNLVPVDLVPGLQCVSMLFFDFSLPLDDVT